MSFYLKDPGSRVTYAIDWLPYLGGETIVDSAWTAHPTESGGLTAHEPRLEQARTAATLSGGIVGHVYSVTNRVTLSDGRIDERAICLRVEER